MSVYNYPKEQYKIDTIYSLKGLEKMCIDLYLKNKEDIDKIKRQNMKNNSYIIVYGEYDYLRKQIENFYNPKNTILIQMKNLGHAFLNSIGMYEGSKKSIEVIKEYLNTQLSITKK